MFTLVLSLKENDDLLNFFHQQNVSGETLADIENGQTKTSNADMAVRTARLNSECPVNLN